MSFSALPWWAVIAGVPAIAAVLYLLQRLRSERRFVAFAAASLWARMPRTTPYRVRGASFRYWLAFLLSLLIAILLWLATANPVVGPTGGDATRVFYLDATAVLTGINASAAKRALMADVRATPARSRTVVLGGAIGTPLLLPGESVSLLAARLDAVEASVRPSTFDAWLRDRLARLPAGRKIEVAYYGGWASAQPIASDPPAALRLRFGYLAPPAAGNRGIVALGASPAASGRAGKADLLIGVAGPTGGVPEPADIVVTHGGKSVAVAAITSVSPGHLLIRDIDADAGTVEVALRDGDAFAADDRAALRLPDRRPVRVAFGASVPATIRAVVAANESVMVTDAADASVVVRAHNDEAGGNTPALILTPVSQGATFTFTARNPASDVPRSRLTEFGLDQIDAAGLADSLDRPIVIDFRQGDERSIAAWGPLFDPSSAFARSAAMPLFVSQSIRWLAEQRGWTPYAKAGAPLPDRSALDGWAERPSDAGQRLQGGTLLGGAGDVGIDGQSVEISLTDARTTVGVAVQPRAGTKTGTDTSTLLPPNPIFATLVVIALLVLAGEWIAYQRGRIP